MSWPEVEQKESNIDLRLTQLIELALQNSKQSLAKKRPGIVISLGQILSFKG